MQNLANGIDSWFEEPYVMATLRMSRRSGQIELKSCVHLTDRIANFVTGMVANCCINWHLFVAKCAVPSGLAHRLCCSKRAVRICVAGGFNSTKEDPSLVAVTLHSHSRVYHWQPVIQCNVGHSSHWGKCTFCVWTLDCGRVRCAQWPIQSSLLQQKSCQNLCCWRLQLHQRGSLSCRSDTAFAYHITVYHWQPVIQYNVDQTWGLLTAPLSEFANVCSWFIWVHCT